MQPLVEGTRRTNRRTGEVQEYRAGQWAQVSPGQAPSAGPGVIQVAPPLQRPPDPPNPGTGFRLNPDGSAAPITGGAADPARPQLPQGYALGPDGRAVRVEGLPPPDAEQPGGDERTAAFHAIRVQGGIDTLAAALATEPGANRPTVGAAIGGLFGPEGRNYMNTPQRQVVEDAQLDILDAALTLGTGAAYTREQLESYRQAYFPTLTDQAPNIEAKRRRLLQLLQASRVRAGRAAPQIDAAIAALQSSVTAEQADGAAADVFQDAANAAGMAASRMGARSATAGPGQPPAEEEPEIRVGEGVFPGYARAPDGSLRPAEEIVPTPDPSIGRSLHMFAGDVAATAGNIAGLVTNPLQVGLNTVFGTNFSADTGEYFRGLTGAPEPGSDAERLSSAVNRGGLGALSLAGLASRAAPLATGAVQNALLRFGGAPLTDMTAGAAGMGASEVTRQAGGGPVAQIMAGLAGGGLTLPISGRVNALFDPAVRIGTPLTRAAEAEGIAIPRAMVDDSRRTQQRVTAVDRTMAGGPIVQRRMDRVGGRIEERVSDLGGGGTPLDPNNAGQTIRGAGERFIRNSGREATRLYNAAETASEGIRVAPQQSLAVVDDMIARLSETGNTNSAELTFLNGLRQDLQNNLSVGALRDLRTTLRKRISDGALVFGQNEARVLDVMDAAGRDIEAGLVSQGRGRAARLFRRADDMYADRMDFIRSGVQRLIGTRNQQLSPERVFANFRAMASPRGDNANLARMVRAMEPEEQADMAATFADALGRGPNGEFSVAQFVRQANRLPDGARLNLFGRRGASSVDNLLTIARDYQRVRGAMGGSPTGVASDYRSWITSLVLGAGSGLLTQSGLAAVGTTAGLAGIKAGRDIVNARLLMSPNIQSWLRSAPRTMNPQAIDDHFGRLREIAAREPALASQIEGLEQAIVRAANDNLERAAAASEPDQQQDR